jgi:hypothetical protein
MDMTFNVMRQGGADDDMIQALREEIETVMRSPNPIDDFVSQLDKFSGHPGWANVINAPVPVGPGQGNQGGMGMGGDMDPAAMIDVIIDGMYQGMMEEYKDGITEANIGEIMKKVEQYLK